MLDPSPTVIWFPSLATAEPDADSAAEERQRKSRRAHATRTDRARRAEDERARLIRLIG
jgi:hypothetical protein